MMPSAADISYFLEVSKSLNLSRAAERLGITQPSLSQAIQRLEAAVGVSLLNRSKRGVTLNQAGRQFQSRARQILQDWESIRSRTLTSAQEVQGVYTLGCHVSVALSSVSQFLPVLLEKHPKLEILLKHDLSRKITEGVISSNIDLGIVVNPIRHPDLVIKKLYHDEVTFWTAPRSGSLLDLHASHGVLICDPDLHQTQWLLKALKKRGIQTRRILSTSSLEVIADLTAHGCGVGILPSRVAHRLHPGKLKRLPGLPAYSDEVSLIFRVENKSIRAVQAIAQAIQI